MGTFPKRRGTKWLPLQCRLLRYETRRSTFYEYVSQADGSTPCVNGDIAIQWEWSDFDPHRFKTR